MRIKYRETIPCELCGTPTHFTGTKRCDRCWELETRINRDVELAEKIIARIKVIKAINGIK